MANPIKERVSFAAQSIQEDLARRGWYLLRPILSALVFLFGVFVAFANPIPTWSKRTRAIILLSAIIVVLLYVAECIYRAHRREANGLNSQIAELSKTIPYKNGRIEDLLTGVQVLRGSIDLKQRELATAKAKHKEEISRLQSEKEVLKNQLEERDGHKLIVEVIRNYSQVYARKHPEISGVNTVRASIGMKFENHTANDMAIKDLSLGVYERTDNNAVRALPIRGAKPTSMTRKPVLSDFQNPDNKIDIEGLTVKGYGISPEYFLLDEIVVDLAADEFINDKHFLKLTLLTVAQKNPYTVDIEVDWTQQGAYIRSATPVTE